MTRSQAYTALQKKLEEIIESYDKDFENHCLDGYAHVWEEDRDDVLKQFQDNYSSKKIGFQAFDDLDGRELSSACLKVMSIKEFTDLILKHLDVRTCDYYVQWNEVGSVTIGEYEHQIDVSCHEELTDLIAACTAEELKGLNYSYSGRHFWAYGNPCDRIVWVITPDSFLTAVEPYLRKAGLTDPARDTRRT